MLGESSFGWWQKYDMPYHAMQLGDPPSILTGTNHS